MVGYDHIYVALRRFERAVRSRKVDKGMTRPDRTTRWMAALWLVLKGQKPMPDHARKTTRSMTGAERVKLLDTAMSSIAPEAYLAGMLSAFYEAGRHDDATIAASLQSLYRAGEIEVLMSMRAEWLGLRSLIQPPSALGL